MTSPGDRSGQALQGWTGGFAGDAFHSIVGFTGSAHYGEVGKTITQALGNATVDRVRIRINQAGGWGGVQPRLGIQTSSVAIPVMNQYLAAMSPGQTTYHILHAPFRTGLKSGQRYITFGPSPKSNAQYAAYHGSSGGNSRRLELEITYTR